MRRGLVALIAYYTVVIVIVGPMCLSQAGADPGARVPMRISINLAMRTPTTDIATFITPAPITVGVASDGSFTVPSNALAFTPVGVAIATLPRLGVLTVQAAAMSDFAGKVNTSTGSATLDGALVLLWSKPSSTYTSAQLQMLDCPVGPFDVHLSTATVGGEPLSSQSSLDPTSRTATLVDSTLAVGAIPAGTSQCAGNEPAVNEALSLPIIATTSTTTSTSTSTSTTTSVPVSSSTTTTTTIAPTTTTTASSSTTTPVAPAVPGTPTPDGLGVALNPAVLAVEPTPSIVSTLTIDPMPLSTTLAPVTGAPTVTGPVTGPGMSTTLAIPATAAQSNARDRLRLRTVKPARHPRSQHNANRHAQTDATTMATGTNSNVNAPALYFSPSYFGSPLRLTAHNLLPASAPLSSLGNSVAHKNPSPLWFVALLSLPLVAFGLGLIASDLGWRPRISGRRRRAVHATRKPSLYP